MALTAIIEEHGGPEQFKLVDLDVGEPGNGEVRIAHKAVGLNFIDVYQRHINDIQSHSFMSNTDFAITWLAYIQICLVYTYPSPRD